jgi:hypothetical protein
MFNSLLPVSKHIQSKEEDVKPHISVSQVNEYVDCGAFYMFHRIYRIPAPSKSFLTIGKSIHKGIEHNFNQKKETKIDLPLNEVQEVTAAEFESLKINTAWDEEESPDQIKDQVVALATIYHNEVAPKIQPKLIEQKIIVEDSALLMPMVFVLDVVDQDDYIRDTKAYGKTPSQDDINFDLQLSGYSFAFRNFTGRTEKGVKLDCLIKLKTPKYVPLESTRNDIDIRRFINITNATVLAIQNGSFVPNQKSFKCSPKRCPYWEPCHRDF